MHPLDDATALTSDPGAARRTGHTSDAFFGRIFRVIGRIPPFGPVSMTTYFHASADELAAHGTAPLAAVADSHVFQRSFCDQSVELCGAGGPLLTTAVQVAFFRF